MSNKRKCIFTNKTSNYKFTLDNPDDAQNWARKVPCTKEYFATLDNRALNKYEIKLVELFYEKEVAQLKLSNLEAQMAEIRAVMASNEEDDGLDHLRELNLSLHGDEDIDEYEIEDILNTSSDVRDKILEEFEKMNVEDVSLQCPKCGTELQNASGIGHFCPKQDCEVSDDHLLHEESNQLTVAPKPVKVEKKITKKKNLWD